MLCMWGYGGGLLVHGMEWCSLCVVGCVIGGRLMVWCVWSGGCVVVVVFLGVVVKLCGECVVAYVLSGVGVWECGGV